MKVGPLPCYLSSYDASWSFSVTSSAIDDSIGGLVLYLFAGTMNIVDTYDMTKVNRP